MVETPFAFHVGHDPRAHTQLPGIAWSFFEKNARTHPDACHRFTRVVDHHSAHRPTRIESGDEFMRDFLWMAARIPTGPIRPIAGLLDAEIESFGAAREHQHEASLVVGHGKGAIVASADELATVNLLRRRRRVRANLDTGMRYRGACGIDDVQLKVTRHVSLIRSLINASLRLGLPYRRTTN